MDCDVPFSFDLSASKARKLIAPDERAKLLHYETRRIINELLFNIERDVRKKCKTGAHCMCFRECFYNHVFKTVTPTPMELVKATDLIFKSTKDTLIKAGYEVEYEEEGGNDMVLHIYWAAKTYVTKTCMECGNLFPTLESWERAKCPACRQIEMT